MSTHPPPVLGPDDLNTTDGRVLDHLHDGRVTPPLIAEELDISREYASERLIRLREHGHVERPASGLYELVDDPRSDEPDETDDEAELRAKLQDALEDAEQHALEADRLRDRVAELEAQTDTGSVDPSVIDDAVDCLDRGLDELPDDVPGRTAIADAKAYLESSIGE